MLDDIKNKVQRLLTQNFNVRLGKSGNWIIDHGSTSVFVEVESLVLGGDEIGQISLNAPLINNVKLTPEVFKWVALDGHFRFGSVIAFEDPKQPGLGLLSFKYSIIGVDVDESELVHSVALVAFTADRLDTELHAKFGGDMMRKDTK